MPCAGKGEVKDVGVKDSGGLFQQPCLDGGKILSQHIYLVGQCFQQELDNRVEVFRLFYSPESLAYFSAYGF